MQLLQVILFLKFNDSRLGARLEDDYIHDQFVEWAYHPVVHVRSPPSQIYAAIPASDTLPSLDGNVLAGISPLRRCSCAMTSRFWL